MKYLIIGTGGTGGAIGGFLADAGKEVDFIARGKHLEAMKENGLKIWSTRKGDFIIKNIRAYTAEEYKEKADVIFVCVKGYSIDEVIPLIEKASHQNTLIIPILNIYGAGEKIQKFLPKLNVMDGCIYIQAYLAGIGEIRQDGSVFRVVYGDRDENDVSDIMKTVESDLIESGIDVVVSQQIKSDTFRKFSFIAPYASVGAYYDVKANEIQVLGEKRNTFIQLVQEMSLLADGLGLMLPKNIIDINITILDHLTPDSTASMQKDIEKGNQSEIDGLLFEVVRMAQKVNIEVPMFTEIARKFKHE